MPGFVSPAFVAKKGQSFRYSATLTADDGVTPIPASSLSTLTLNLIDDATGVVINSRNNQNVLNANGVTVSEAGVLVWSGTAADSSIVTPGLANGRTELHRATFKWTWSSGTKKGAYRLWISVEENSDVA
ncbi:MAG: hypothetical protein NT069_15755 [Planctomycetota bacterium]|nr:hypothetical protein [Planctomycetota bacterium]